MSTARQPGLSRRQFGTAFGVLLASFALPADGLIAEVLPDPGSGKNRRLDGWIRIAPDGVITVFTGKAELGQGIHTALAQVAAEELDVGLGRIRVLGPDTRRGPDEGYTYGSQSIEQSGSSIRMAAAEARAVLVNAAARKLRVSSGLLRVENGIVVGPNDARVSYAELAARAPKLLVRDVGSPVRTKAPSQYKLVGQSTPRLDLPAKLLGQPAYVQDMRLPGMLFGRVVRPPHPGARLVFLDATTVRAMPGIIAVVKNGSFLGVVAAREEEAIAARQTLIDTTRWTDEGVHLPDQGRLAGALKELPSEDSLVEQKGLAVPTQPGLQSLRATYTRPYLSHASIGPSCAVAMFEQGRVTVWSHTQGTFPLRRDLATALNLSMSKVNVVHVAGSGCYGHNGADDVAFDAALLARAVDGRPVKVQWMRDDEFGWSPASPAMVMQVEATLSRDGKIVDWKYELWSNSHTTRPGEPGGVNLLGSWYLETPYHMAPPVFIPQPYGNGDRNAVPVYEMPRRQVLNHMLTDMPIRTSSLRTLGGQGNIFAIECFMDELAQASDQDPIAFRLTHLTDPRARDVINAVAHRVGWIPKQRGDGRRGRGFAYARYKNISTYAAVAVDIEVDSATGRIDVLNAVVAVDVGRVVNPDGVMSQAEGGVVQGLSWALMESLTFDERRITSLDWVRYPIMRFPNVPAIEVILLDRPDQPSIGVGEGSVGPASAALANALANATGHRARDLPLSPLRVSG